MTAGTMKAAAEEYLIGYFDVPPGKPTVVEFVEALEAAEHDAHRRRRAGRDPPGCREGRGGELQGAGAGRPVGGDRRAAARLLAAAEPPPLFGDLTQRPDPDDRSRLEVVSRSRWPMPSGFSATSLAGRSGGP